MKIPLSLCRGLAVLTWLVSALRLAAVEPAPDGTAPLPGETVFIPELKGVICVPDATALAEPPPAGFTGVDTSRTPLLADPAAAELIRMFLGKPMSFGSLDRLCIGVRTWLRLMGQPFVTVQAPPQDVTGGIVRLVVEPVRLDGELQVDGAKWFSEKSYRTAIPVQPGAAINAQAVQAGVERLNTNPYRRVAIAAEPGATSGTTKLTLRTQETRPWEFMAGYNNTGTAVTDEDRVLAGVTWGNAFGRGDILSYNLSADPAFQHSVSHSLNYSTAFTKGWSLSFLGSYSSVESVLPEPLTQEGTSWQLGARLGKALKPTAGKWQRRLEFAADFKYADNNLEFATIPISDNVTHVAQAGVSFSISRQREKDSMGVTVGIFGSPGGITGRNDDEAFEGSRAGASSSYIYGKLDGYYSRVLPAGFTFSSRLSVQTADGPLLGVEQLAGSGSVAVRGYRESAVFGDEGIIGSVELHAPQLTLARIKGRLDAFVFLDAGTLHNLGPEGDYTELAGAGPGLNLAIGPRFSLTAAYGWQLKEIPYLADQGSGFCHISATLRF